MAWGVNSVLNMGVRALFASQASIQTTGNNISNVDTPGYTRRYVVLEEANGLDAYPGRVGEGVLATEVQRYFDKFIEKNYLGKLGTSSRYTTEYNQLRNVENLFNEANVSGTASAIAEFFDAWNTLAQSPSSQAARTALLGKSDVLMDEINNTDRSLRELEDQMNSMIREEVDKANLLIREIAALNKEIAASYLAGRNNPNDLLDARDAKVRALGEIIDVTVDDKGPGHYNVSMANGYTLMQDTIPFSLEFRGMQAENNLTTTSPYKSVNPQNDIHFSGSDNYEYTIEIIDTDPPTTPQGNGGTVGAGARFRVSIDGGRTWLKDENGNDRIFNANEEGQAVRVGELDIWFDPGSLNAGDRFLIWPKPDVYWISPTSDPINISTQIYADGTDNSLRITGGILGGLLEVRDYDLAEYRDRLDALARGLIWEVNRIHSQGAGLEPMTYALGTYEVGNTAVPLGTPEARFTWSDKLQAGNMTFAVYGPDGKLMTDYPGLNVLAQAGGNFDPAVHSLQDAVAAINDSTFYVKDELTGDISATYNPFFAQIVNGKLEISMNTGQNPNGGAPPAGCSFAMTADTTGLAAALGINTFFEGHNADTFAVRGELSVNTNLINAGRLNGAGEINSGDNITARETAALATKHVSIGTYWVRPTTQSISDYYANLVTKVGTDTQSAKFVSASETAMATDLYNRQLEISGVNLDEEMANLIKFQASYKAAAKLITTADEMLQTLLSLKP
ncbi:MAG: flagellar hook-associated protein FlgK [Desulfovibrio sp.]|jgi:flagellar hook-associated protein 1 FlgK|nr:flagellar hook-associated protein FlgK [Desulfovibrio sp.]